MFDLLVAEMRCPGCGTVSPITAHTNMQTHIRDDADGSALGIGFTFDPRDLTMESLLDASYALLAEPAPGGPVRVLEVWSCPACKTEQWGMVTIAEGRIQQIEAVSRAMLEAASFISERSAGLMAESTSGDVPEGTVDPVKVLLEKLA
jgi:phage FluMu protein Com